MARRRTEPTHLDSLTSLLGSLYWISASLLPAKVRWHAGSLLGMTIYCLLPSRRHVVQRNLEICFPEMTPNERKRNIVQAFKYAGRGILSWGFAMFAKESRVRKEITWEGREYLEQLIRSQRPVILLHPHFTAPLITLRAIGQLSDVVAMYKPPKNPIFDMGFKCSMEGLQSNIRWVNVLYRKRSNNAIKLIPSYGNMRPIYRAMKNATPFFFLPDQNSTSKKHSEFVPFFGVTASTYSSLTRFVQFANAEVVMCYSSILDKGKGYLVTIEPLPENLIQGFAKEDATRMNMEIEKHVQRQPLQYFWLHKRFKSRPPGEPSLY